MKISITGSGGFIGSNLAKKLSASGSEVVRAGRQDISIDDERFAALIDGSDCVVNLAGAGIAARWTADYKKEIYDSRVNTTAKIVRAFAAVKNKPSVFISVSAVGIYSDKRTFTEDDAEYGNGFLAGVCRDWEAEALAAENHGIRTVVFRMGVVLGRNQDGSYGGALQKMIVPFSLGLGGVIGSGAQHFSWVALEDVLEAFSFAMKNQAMRGVYNLTAPGQATNRAFSEALGRALSRPVFFTVPEFVLRLAYSEGSSILTGGQSAYPKRLIDAGFKFAHPDLAKALSRIVRG